MEMQSEHVGMMLVKPNPFGVESGEGCEEQREGLVLLLGILTAKGSRGSDQCSYS